MSTYRLMTAGSVDDGKSTLIGRLLIETDSVPLDQIEAVANAKGRAALIDYKGKKIDLSLLTDGLIDERAQGITIDVAYRYFHHQGHSFILADAPGHVQYTRNMITAASHSDVALILIDPTRIKDQDDLLLQTKRHTLIAHALGLKLIGVVNKMDAVDWDHSIFKSIQTRYQRFLEGIGAEAVAIIPCSALRGDSILHRSTHMPWYQGSTLIEAIELTHQDSQKETHVEESAYVTIQNSLRDPEQLTRRLYGVRVGGNKGSIRVGDLFRTFPGQEDLHIKGIYLGEKSLTQATSGQSVSIEVDQQVGLAHGDWLLPIATLETFSRVNHLNVSLCWMNTKPMKLGMSGKYLAKVGSRTLWVRVNQNAEVFNWNTLEWERVSEVGLNDLAKISLAFSEAIPVRPFIKGGDQQLSTAILIDPSTNETVAAVWFDQGIEVDPLAQVAGVS